MKTLQLAVVSAAILVSLPTFAEKSRPMSEMKGDCSNFAMKLGAEFDAWKSATVPVSASKDAASSSALKLASAPLGKKLAIRLQPAQGLKEVVKPGRGEMQEEGTFGGIVSFETSEAGAYRIATGKRLWFEVIDAATKKPVESSTFEMQTRCPTIFKVVVFPLQAKKTYWIQFSGSENDQVEALIRRE